MNLYILCNRFRTLLSNPTMKKFSVTERCLMKALPPIQNIQKSSLFSASYSAIISKGNITTRSFSIKVPPPPPSPQLINRDHGRMWILERVVALSTLMCIVWVFEQPSELFECGTALFISAHALWGLDAIFTDYLRPAVVGNLLSKSKTLLAPVLSVLLCASLAWSAIYGNGIVRSIQQIWYLDLDVNPYRISEQRKKQQQ